MNRYVTGAVIRGLREKYSLQSSVRKEVQRLGSK